MYAQLARPFTNAMRQPRIHAFQLKQSLLHTWGLSLQTASISNHQACRSGGGCQASVSSLYLICRVLRAWSQGSDQHWPPNAVILASQILLKGRFHCTFTHLSFPARSRLGCRVSGDCQAPRRRTGCRPPPHPRVFFTKSPPPGTFSSCHLRFHEGIFNQEIPSTLSEGMTERNLPVSLREQMNDDREVFIFHEWFQDYSGTMGSPAVALQFYDKDTSRFAQTLENQSLRAAIQRYKETQPKNDFWENFNPDSCSWDQVVAELDETTRFHRTKADGNAIRRSFRGLGVSRNMGPLLESIPQDNGLGVLKGGLLIIFNVRAKFGMLSLVSSRAKFANVSCIV
ncbi:hypothetical protein NCS55_00962000 [Fusarium keratoplasticum]|nr:hypothetical protein NCS55_00962000 [Fusarium keratoplasticum]